MRLRRVSIPFQWYNIQTTNKLTQSIKSNPPARKGILLQVNEVFFSVGGQ